MSDLVLSLVRAAAAARTPLLTDAHDTALRLFNGYTEGCPGLAIDLYARTLVLHDASGPKGNRELVDVVVTQLRELFPWVTAALWKIRESKDSSQRNGVVVFGTEQLLARKVREDGVWYTVRLQLNRDASFYLDTRQVRAWAKQNLSGAKVLNAFAYTGSLGVAARAGPAERVVHTDINKAFLTVAKDSYALNGWPISRADFITGDFFDVMGRLKREKLLFDCVFLDPPIFSVTQQGRVEPQEHLASLINKVRPIISDGGALVIINNGVFVSGASFKAELDALCADGYLSMEAILPTPEDFVGMVKPGGPLPADPAPFNHSTKVAVLRVKRKDARRPG
jgi:23S rRNA (cytosine1962-C5)-methyltransferase